MVSVGFLSIANTNESVIAQHSVSYFHFFFKSVFWKNGTFEIKILSLRENLKK